jgi:NTE family protein
MAVLVSDFMRLAKSLIKLAEENGVNKEAIQKILNEETKAVYLATGKHWSFESLLKDNVDVDFVVCLERKDDKSYYFE